MAARRATRKRLGDFRGATTRCTELCDRQHYEAAGLHPCTTCRPEMPARGGLSGKHGFRFKEGKPRIRLSRGPHGIDLEHPVAACGCCLLFGFTDLDGQLFLIKNGMNSFQLVKKGFKGQGIGGENPNRSKNPGDSNQKTLLHHWRFSH